VGPADEAFEQLGRRARRQVPDRFLQVIPHGNGSFVILNFPPLPAPYPDAAEDQMVYVDTLTGALYLERPAEIAAYSAAYEQLQAVALGPKESRDTLSKIVSDLAM
jgi:hypothetical protein